MAEVGPWTDNMAIDFPSHSLINIDMTITYTQADAEELNRLLLTNPMFPVVQVRLDTLGGAHRASLMISLSMDPRSTWTNGIYQNSRYAQFHINDGKIWKLSGYGTPKLRKSVVVSVEAVAKLLNKWSMSG